MSEHVTITLFCQNQQSPHTERNARYILRRFAAWIEAEHGVTDVEKVTAAHVIAYRQHLEKSITPASIARQIQCIRSFSRWAFQEGLVPADFAKNVKAPRAERNKEPEFLTTDESRKLFDAIPNTKHQRRDRALLWCLAYGLRVTEIASLDSSDLIAPADGKLPALSVSGKRAYHRSVPISERAYQDIKCHVESRGPVTDGPLFVTHYDGAAQRIAPRTIQEWFSALVTSAGLPRAKAHCHAARHGMVMRMLFECDGGPATLFVVSKLAGHTNLETTRAYLHYGEQGKRAAEQMILADPLAMA
jgi:site-specific recombinase XerD